ncbi:hypothetical protein VTN00DRAFT_895 [Thermoascus crustaceus]|uniref:uncharacterized protein n=1 Tax=Thermoascus crustaceus TaxID=5088 RepID=UPI0037449CB4
MRDQTRNGEELRWRGTPLVSDAYRVDRHSPAENPIGALFVNYILANTPDTLTICFTPPESTALSTRKTCIVHYSDDGSLGLP